MENRIIDQQLDLLRDKLLLLGGTTEKALQRAMQSLTGRDSELAQQVLLDDKIINQMELEIDQLCIEILALQQPAAHDLRFVISVAKITPILERIADHSCSVAKAALILNNEPKLDKYVDLPKMADNAAEMLHAALDAFTTEDSEASRKIIKQDRVINKSYKRIFGELIQMMISDPSIANSGAQLLFAAKHLERIGDYVKDICELNVYLIEAAFIKHSKKSSK